MNTCSSCTYWHVSQWEKDGEKGFKRGICFHWKMHEDRYFEKTHTYAYQAPERDTAFAIGYDAVRLDLETGPDFGCIHHECK